MRVLEEVIQDETTHEGCERDGPARQAEGATPQVCNRDAPAFLCRAGPYAQQLTTGLTHQ